MYLGLGKSFSENLLIFIEILFFMSTCVAKDFCVKIDVYFFVLIK